MTLSNDTTNERRQFIISKSYISEYIFYLILLLEILAVVCWIGFYIYYFYFFFDVCCCCFISIIEHKHVLPLPTQHNKTTTANSFYPVSYHKSEITLWVTQFGKSSYIFYYFIYLLLCNNY